MIGIMNLIFREIWLFMYYQVLSEKYNQQEMIIFKIS